MKIRSSLLCLALLASCATVEDTRVRDADVTVDSSALDANTTPLDMSVAPLDDAEIDAAESVADADATDAATSMDAEVFVDATPADAAVPVVVVCGPGVRTCAAGEYCRYADGSCGLGDATGVCTPVPTVDECTSMLRQPVCACNGLEYRRPCDALRSGVDVTTAAVCETHAGCAAQDVTAIVPESSTILGFYFDGNSCLPLNGDGCTGRDCANLFGTNEACVTAHLGCNLGESVGLGCGPLGVACSDTEFCDFPAGSCGGDGTMGTCTARPELCGRPSIRDSACSCANTSYSSVCEAQMAGIDANPGFCSIVIELGDGGLIRRDLGLVLEPIDGGRTRLDFGLVPIDPEPFEPIPSAD